MQCALGAGRAAMRKLGRPVSDKAAAQRHCALDSRDRKCRRNCTASSTPGALVLVRQHAVVTLDAMRLWAQHGTGRGYCSHTASTQNTQPSVPMDGCSQSSCQARLTPTAASLPLLRQTHHIKGCVLKWLLREVTWSLGQYS